MDCSQTFSLGIKIKTMKKYVKYLFVIALMVIIFTACAKIEPDTTCFTGKIYGFWNGLWHGIISWIMFFASLVRDDVAVYAINNNGAWYDFGFLLGVSAWGGGTKTVYKYR